MSEKTRAWALVGAWVALQLTATSLPGDAVPDVGFDADELAHVVMYGVLGLLVVRALRHGARGTAPVRLLLAWPVLALFGALDEWHQRFIPGRYPSVSDGVLDAIGAALGLWLGWILLRKQWAAWIR